MANLSQVAMHLFINIPAVALAVVESYVVETLQLLQQFSGLNSSLSYMDEYWQMRLT